MKKKLSLHLLAVVLIVVLVAALSVSAFAADEGAHGGETSIEGLTASKYVTVQDDGTYVVDLEAFSTGEVHTETVNVPADIILVLDVSGSMTENMTSYTYTARSSQGYSYSNYGYNTYYYKDGDNYYQVSRTNARSGGWYSDRWYSLYYTKNNTTYYLNGTETTTTRPANTSETATIWTGVLYTRTSSSQTKLAALKSAVNGFIDEVASKNQEAINAGTTDVNKLSRIAIVKFSGNAAESNYANYQEGNSAYWSNYYDQYIEYSQVVSDLGVVTPGTTGNVDDWKDIVDGLNARGMTRADYGMAYANAIVNKHASDHNYTDETAEDYRSRVVVMFTDGTPTSGSDFEASVANSAISSARSMKSNNVSVYSVAVLQGANPALDPTASGTSNENKYLHAVSSNYPNATAYNNLGTRGTGNYYFAAESADQLAEIFKQIGQSSGSTTSTLNSETVMKDIVSSSFTLPEGASADTVKVKIVRWNSTTHAWGTADTGDVYTPEQWKTVCTSFGAKEAENVAVELSADGKTVDITGFDYATHYKATSAEQDNDTVDVVNGPNKYTAKVVVSFPIQARPSAVTGGSVATNGDKSGIYINGEEEDPILKFEVPEVVFTPVTYVVDYVTSDTTHDTKVSTVKLDYSSVLKNVQMLDDPSDDYLIGEDAADFGYTIYKGKYGTISFGDDEFDVQRRYVRYAPTTMNWDNYDRIFIKGESASESNLDVWAMLCVIPANSVFYEDTYITQTKTVEYNGQTVEIKYTGINYDSSWTTVGTEGTNTTQHAGDDMGWIEGLADDSSYANDMAHTANTAKAKATFTFTGTGVDIYSRTNGTTGTVTVKLQGVNPQTGKKFSKMQAIDTKAAAGDFFAVPVCTFTDLTYGEYTVTITVTAAAQAEGRLKFFLDGVRVYNPIQPLEEEENVQIMYGEKNLGAVFTEVRSMLGSSGAATAEALYIDEHLVSEEVPDVDAIQEAAKALAAAQDARDAYVDGTITPAKNEVINAQYAVPEAEQALANATTVYNYAVAALEEARTAGASDEEIAKLEEAVTKADADKATAQAAYDNAVAKYTEAYIKGLQDALDAAIAGKAQYDKAVDDARVAYETASDNKIIVAYNEATIADYDKEGPKSELYLDKGQKVTISVESGKYYYIGLRSLFGDEVNAKIGTKSVKLSHTVDLYYEATPSGGTIVVQNDGDGVLAVTKLRTTGVDNTTSGTKFASSEEMLAYAVSIADVYDSAFDGEVLTEDEAYAEEPSVETPAEEVPEVIDLDESEISIENPEVSSGSGSSGNTGRRTSSISAMSGMINSFKGFVKH